MTLEQFSNLQLRYQWIRRIALITALFSLAGLFFEQVWVLLVVLVCLGINSYVQDKFTKTAYRFKHEQLKNAIESRFPNIKYDMEKGISSGDVYGSRLIERGDHYHSEDLLTGKIGQTRFRTADVKVQFDRMSRHGHQRVTRFAGKYYEIALPMTVNVPVYIVNNGAEKFGIKQGLQRVDFEYIDFNNEVDVYCSNPEVAFKLLKPKAMEAILKLRKKHGSIAFAFMNKTMVVAMEGRNSFEFYIHRRVSKRWFEQIEQEINTLIDLTTALQEEVI